MDIQTGHGGFETIGVGRIPAHQQTSTPWTFFGILVGGNLALGVMVFGWISITLGLGTIDALTSITAGVLVGIPLVWALVLIGSRTATNNSTASGAHFGVRGRLIGSIVGLAISLTYTAIAVWSAGATMGCLAIDCSLYTGPLAGLAGGIDLSFAGSALVSLLVYGVLQVVLPETMGHRAVHIQPDGPAIALAEPA